MRRESLRKQQRIPCLYGMSTDIGSGLLTLLPRDLMQLDEPYTAQCEAVAAQARAKGSGIRDQDRGDL